MKIRVLWEGKTKDAHVRAIQQDLAERIGHFTTLSLEEFPAPHRAASSRGTALSTSERALLEKLGRATKVWLDPRGRERTSEEFARWLETEMVRGSRELAFVVGGPDGFSAPFREQADELLSLSRMTLTHDWARVFLLEQIYRAFAIMRGFPYAK